MNPLRRRVFGAAGCALLATLAGSALTGCSATSSYELSVSEAHSAVETARLAVQLFSDGESTSAVAETAVADAVDQVLGAESALAQTRSGTEGEASAQSTALDLVHEATNVLLETERQLTSGSVGPDELTSLGERLDALDDALQAAS